MFPIGTSCRSVSRARATILGRLRTEGVTVALVEQNARMALADQVLVLNKGAIVVTGPAEEFRRLGREPKGRYLSVERYGRMPSGWSPARPSLRSAKPSWTEVPTP